MIKIARQLDTLAKKKTSTFYKLTKKGFEIFIDFKNCEPKDFWYGLLWYYILKKDPPIEKENLIKDPDFEKYCEKYYSKYIGRNFKDLYLLSNLFFLDALYNRYRNSLFQPIRIAMVDISEYANAIKSIFGDKLVNLDVEAGNPIILDKIYYTLRSVKNEISDERKVIEALALHGYSSIFELSNYTNLTSAQVTKVIDNFTVAHYVPKFFNDKELEDEEKIIEEYLNFLSHNLILKSSEKEKKYSLSLFGILLVLKVWHKDYIEVETYLSSIFEQATRKFSNITANNYQEKLPLIFGKLENIERITYSGISELFRPIFDSEKRLEFYSTPIQFGGNKEIYEIINNVSLETSNRLYKIFSDGKSVINTRLNYLDENKRSQYKHLKNYYKKLLRKETGKISILLKYVNIFDFVKDIVDNYDENAHTYGISLRKEINITENLLSKEITFLIFINFIKKGYIWKNPPFFFPYNPNIQSLPPHNEPLKTFQEIDNDINNQFLIWINDAIEYNNRTTGILNSLNNEMTPSKN